ncbi:MAG: heme exporter protein CcmD [Leucothrix sp.]
MSEFFAMGGYGFYVWSSMGMVLFLMLLEPILLNIQHKRLLKTIQRQKRRQAASKT